jgi:hypothetical protein
MSIATIWSLRRRLETRDIITNYADNFYIYYGISNVQMIAVAVSEDNIMSISPCMDGDPSVVVCRTAHLSKMFYNQSMEQSVLSYSHCTA